MKLLINILASSLGTAVLLVGVFLIWMDRVYTEYSTLLRLSRYRVVIPADPGIVGKLRRLRFPLPPNRHVIASAAKQSPMPRIEIASSLRSSQ